MAYMRCAECIIMRTQKTLFLKEEFTVKVRIVNGINKYATETSDEIFLESVQLVRTGRLVTKANPRPKPAATLKLDRRRSRTMQKKSVFSSVKNL